MIEHMGDAAMHCDELAIAIKRREVEGALHVVREEMGQRTQQEK